MSSSTYSGISRTVPILPFPVAGPFSVTRGMVVQYNSGTNVVEPWSAGTNVAFGVATGDADQRLLIVDIFLGRGCSVLIRCDLGVVPEPNDFLFWSAPGVVSNSGTAGQQFARAIGVGMNSMVEAIIC